MKIGLLTASAGQVASVCRFVTLPSWCTISVVALRPCSCMWFAIITKRMSDCTGGFSVHSQLVMPCAHGLFQKAIVESGAYGDTNQLTLASAQTQGDTFASSVNCPSPCPMAEPSFQYHAAHASELEFLWNLQLSAPATTKPLTPDEQALAATMVKYWTQCAKSGNPNSSGSPTWPVYTTANDSILTLDTPASSVRVTTGFNAARKCQ